MSDEPEPPLLEQLDQLETILEARRHVKRGLVLGLAALAAGAASGQIWVIAAGVASLLYAGFFFVRQRLVESALPDDSAASLSEPEARPREGVPVHALPEPTGPVNTSWIATQLTLEEPVSFPTSGGAELELPKGELDVEFRFRFRPERGDGDDLDVLRAGIRVRSARGAWWHTETFLDPDALLLPFASEQQAEENAGRIVFWEEAPDEWRGAMQSHCHIAGVRGLLDSRERFELPVGDREVTMMLKYQGPIVDLAWLAAEHRLLVRASGLVYELWKNDERDDIVDQVTFAYLLAPDEILLPTALEFHWVEWQEWWEGDDDRRKQPVFEPLETG